MYRFLEQKPVVATDKIINSKARTWTARLLDGRFPEEPEAVGFLKASLVNSMNPGSKGAITNIQKVLIVTCESLTQIFITLLTPKNVQEVKRLLQSLLSSFQEHIWLHALATVHMMNDRDESSIQTWWMAGEFEEEQKYEDTPKRKENLHLLQGSTIVKYSGAEGCLRVETQLSTISNQIIKLENQLALPNECPNEIHNMRMALNKAKHCQEDMQDRLKRCMAVVVNFKPDVVLYKVDFMSEAEREQLIQDRLDLTLKYDAKTYVSIYEDPDKKAEAAEFQN